MTFYRLPLVRHIRYVWHAYRMTRHYRFWRALGYVGPRESDLALLQDIWDGKA